MPSIEIGGNFCLSPEQIDIHSLSEVYYGSSILGFNDVIFTHGGRSAIVLAVKNMGLEESEVLIPDFSCHSITDAFVACGCKCHYYHINRDLTVDVDSVKTIIKDCQPRILFTCSLFGFETLNEIKPLYKDFKDKGIIIIEDVSHALLKEKFKSDADILVCSLRKWLEIPDGGFVKGLKKIDHTLFYKSYSEHKKIKINFIEASKSKFIYLNNGDDSLKESFLPLFYANNDLFDDCSIIYKMSQFSYHIAETTDWKTLSDRRRQNYRFLLQNIKSPLIEFIFPEISDYESPLYMQVYVKGGKRDDLQKHLISNKLYCPVVWPTPPRVSAECASEKLVNHKDMLSLVVDQRYDLEDMKRLTDCINQFKK
ncbi:MAG: aminotransferase class V-fold PLP-dependent enzyme [Odoribacter splanchnicus]